MLKHIIIVEHINWLKFDSINTTWSVSRSLHNQDWFVLYAWQKFCQVMSLHLGRDWNSKTIAGSSRPFAWLTYSTGDLNTWEYSKRILIQNGHLILNFLEVKWKRLMKLIQSVYEASKIKRDIRTWSPVILII